jgi:hypothetical protein
MESTSSRGPRKSLSFVLLLSCLVNGALAHPHLNVLQRRAVEWVNPSQSRASSSICGTNEQGWIAHWQTETASLAAAGAQGLTVAFNALFNPAGFGQLSEQDRSRYFQTYISFFGYDDDEDEDDDEDAGTGGFALDAQWITQIKSK